MPENFEEVLGKGLLAELETCRDEEEAINVLKRENLWGVVNHPELEELKESYKNGEIEADGTLSLSQLDKVAGGGKGNVLKIDAEIGIGEKSFKSRRKLLKSKLPGGKTSEEQLRLEIEQEFEISEKEIEIEIDPNISQPAPPRYLPEELMEPRKINSAMPEEQPSVVEIKSEESEKEIPVNEDAVKEEVFVENQKDKKEAPVEERVRPDGIGEETKEFAEEGRQNEEHVEQAEEKSENELEQEKAYEKNKSESDETENSGADTNSEPESELEKENLENKQEQEEVLEENESKSDKKEISDNEEVKDELHVEDKKPAHDEKVEEENEENENEGMRMEEDVAEMKDEPHVEEVAKQDEQLQDKEESEHLNMASVQEIENQNREQSDLNEKEKFTNISTGLAELKDAVDRCVFMRRELNGLADFGTMSEGIRNVLVKVYHEKRICMEGVPWVEMENGSWYHAWTDRTNMFRMKVFRNFSFFDNLLERERSIVESCIRNSLNPGPLAKERVSQDVFFRLRRDGKFNDKQSVYLYNSATSVPSEMFPLLENVDISSMECVRNLMSFFNCDHEGNVNRFTFSAYRHREFMKHFSDILICNYERSPFNYSVRGNFMLSTTEEIKTNGQKFRNLLISIFTALTATNSSTFGYEYIKHMTEELIRIRITKQEELKGSNKIFDFLETFTKAKDLAPKRIPELVENLKACSDITVRIFAPWLNYFICEHSKEKNICELGYLLFEKNLLFKRNIWKLGNEFSSILMKNCLGANFFNTRSKITEIKDLDAEGKFSCDKLYLKLRNMIEKDPSSTQENAKKLRAYLVVTSIICVSSPALDEFSKYIREVEDPAKDWVREVLDQCV